MLWENATYSQDDFRLLWKFIGKYAKANMNVSVELKEVNTLYNGKCFEWRLRDRVNKTNRIIKAVSMSCLAHFISRTHTKYDHF